MLVDQKKHQQQLKAKGRNGKTRFSSSWALAALSTITVLVIVATFLVWTTDIVKLALSQNMGIENNTLTYNLWVNPPVLPFISIYVFNYTNADEFSKGKVSKLKVQEVGPYVYRKNTEKVNIVFNHNGTVSYQEKNSFKFVPERSGGHWPHQDNLSVPNMPLLSAIYMLKDWNLLTQMAFLAMSSGIAVPEFARITAQDFFWGYDDQLYNLALALNSFVEEMPFTKFGILVMKNGTLGNHMTIYTGKEDVNKLGVVTRFNGQESFRHWSKEDCNRIDGTDGTMFPPHLVRRNSTIYIFSSDMCRLFPLEYTEDITAHNSIPALRFRPPRNVFADPEENPENACYCNPENEFCPPSGVFKATPCAKGAPLMLSFPHFYLGDPILLETVEGLKPDPEKHDLYLDVHEELGVPVDGVSRIQINMLVRKSATLNSLVNFEDGSILPIFWFETGIDGLPDEIMDMFYHVTFTARHVQFAMQYLLPVLSIVLLYLLVRRKRSHSTEEDITDIDAITPK